MVLTRTRKRSVPCKARVKMLHIRNRNDLFKILEERSPSPAINAALDTGGIELLGGFKRVPPSDNPAWIVVITSRRKTVWNVVLTIHEHSARVSTWIVQRIPWEHWVGKTDRDPGIYDGDNPIEYEKRKQKARVTNGYQ